MISLRRRRRGWCLRLCASSVMPGNQSGAARSAGWTRIGSATVNRVPGPTMLSQRMRRRALARYRMKSTDQDRFPRPILGGEERIVDAGQLLGWECTEPVSATSATTRGLRSASSRSTIHRRHRIACVEEQVEEHRWR